VSEPSANSLAAPGETRRVLWLSLAQLISWGSVFYLFALLVGPVEAELGLTRAQTSLAFSLALLVEGMLAWPVGRWIDHGHERLVMTGGSLVLAVALLLHSQARSVVAFYGCWLLLGAGMAATLYTPVFAVVTRRYPQDFRRAIITLTFLGGLASTVFIPLIAWLIREWGWRGALVALAGLHLFVCAPLHAAWLRGAPRQALPAQPGPAAAPPPQSLRRLLRGAPFLLIALFTVLMMGITAAIPPHLVSLLREAGMSEAWVLAVPASIGVIQVVGRVLLFVTEKRFDVDRANRWIPCLIPLGLGALLFGGAHVAAATVFVLLYGLGNGMLTIVKGTAIAQYVSRAHVAALNGAMGVPQALARAAAPLLLGLLWTPARGYQWGLALLLAASVVAVLALWQAQRRALLSKMS